MKDNDHNPLYGDPFQNLLDHLEANGIRYSCKREERRAWFSMNSGNAVQKCRFNFDKTGDVLQIFIEYPVMVKEPFRATAAEFITRANYGLVVGNFEMDWKDGEIRYHVSHVMPEGKLEDDMIRRLFGTALGTADRYYPALMQVLYAGSTPEDAVYIAELDYHAAHVEEPTKKGRKVSKDECKPKASTSKSKPSGNNQTPSKKKAPRKGHEKTVAPSDAGKPDPVLKKQQDSVNGTASATPPPTAPAPPAPRVDAQGEASNGDVGEDRKAA